MTDTTSTRPQMVRFSQYRRSQIAELRPYVEGETLDRVSISAPDKEAGSPKSGDMIAHNPKNHDDQWLVAAQYFADNFEPVASLPQPTAGSTGGVAGLDLDAIEARANAATPGPWGIESCGEKGDGSNMIGVLFDADVDTNCERPILGWTAQYRPVTEEFIEYYRDELVAECDHRNRKSGADAELIAYARTDIPALIAEVRALRASTPAQSVLVEDATAERASRAAWPQTWKILDESPQGCMPDVIARRAISRQKMLDDMRRGLAAALSHAPSQPAPVVAASRLQAMIAELKSFPPSPLLEDAIDSLERIS